MAIPTNIKTLLSGSVVEWARIELKESWDPAASLKTICAFANDFDNWGGGYVILGVETNDDGRPVYPLKGVPIEKIDRTLKDILNKCKMIQPEYLPIVEVVDYQEKKLIIIWVPSGYYRPYSSPKTMAKDDKERVYYIRKMASTITPSKEQLRDLFSLANVIPFDDRINHEAELSDLNITLIQSYLYETESSLYEESKNMSFLDLCRSLNIVGSLPEYAKPRNVGLMFFSLEPDKFFPYAHIDVVEFPDDVGGDKITEKIFKGPLHNQLREALLYIYNRVIQENVVKLPDVPEARRFFNYPFAAIEESLANAVYHKGYDEREPIEVRIMPDHIMIVSHPGADRSLSIEELKNRKAIGTRYRNRRIGSFLKEMHLTEGRNTGFKKILNALKSNGSPLPDFYTDEHRLTFAVTLYQHPEFVPGGTVNGINNGATKLGDGINEGITETNELKILKKEPINDLINDLKENDFNNSQKFILKLISENPRITQKQLAEKLKINERNIRKNIKQLKDKGKITYTGSKKTGYWIVI